MELQMTGLRHSSLLFFHHMSARAGLLRVSRGRVVKERNLEIIDVRHLVYSFFVTF